jgi:hypothetical protein
MLRALMMFYEHCILNQVNIIFDMTLLEPEISIPESALEASALEEKN